MVADLDGDHLAEVIFTFWVEKETHQTGKLHILDHLGNPIHEVPLPNAFGNDNWNGRLAAPTLDNIDADADLELVVNTAHSGAVAYDLPGTAMASILWQTGRGSYRRNGVGIPPEKACAADLDEDNDVDGRDLAQWIQALPMGSTSVIAGGFGRSDCP